MGHKIIDIDSVNIGDYGICGYKSMKKDGLPQKHDWLKAAEKTGLKIRAYISEEHGLQGMIEYLPGEYCWRPVKAEGFMFIHCIYSGMKKQYKKMGVGAALLEKCEKDAEAAGMKGVAVVTRKGSFMVEPDFFLKRGYIVADKADPDFSLLVKSFDGVSDSPCFMPQVKSEQAEDRSGLVLYRAGQCPYTVKNVKEMVELAKDEFDMELKVIDIVSYEEAQKVPGAFGTFGITFNNRLVADHPVSKGRLRNIINKLSR